MAFTASEWRMIRDAVGKVDGVDTSDWKMEKKKDQPWYKKAAGAVGGAALGGAALGPIGYGAGALAGYLGTDGDRTKNLTNPSEWRGGEVGDALNTVSGRSAAKKQEDAANKAAEDAQRKIGGALDFVKEQQVTGREDIQTGTTGATGAVDTGKEGALSSLLEGRDQALQALGAAPNRLAALLADPNSFQQDPGYQFRLKQGEDAIMHSAAARGGRMGGDTLKALLEHGQNFATNEYGNAINRAAMADNADFARAAGQAGVWTGTGGQAAGIHTGTGQSLADILERAGINLSNLGVQTGQTVGNLATGQANAGMFPVQYAGGADQATANFATGLLNAGGQIGAAAVGGAMGRPAAPAAPQAPQTYRV